MNGSAGAPAVMKAQSSVRSVIYQEPRSPAQPAIYGIHSNNFILLTFVFVILNFLYMSWSIPSQDNNACKSNMCAW